MKKTIIIILILLLSLTCVIASEQTDVINNAFMDAQANLTGKALPPTFQKILKDESISININNQTSTELSYTIIIEQGITQKFNNYGSAESGIIVNIPEDVAYTLITSENGGKLFFDELNNKKITIDYNVSGFKKLRYKTLIFLAKKFV